MIRHQAGQKGPLGSDGVVGRGTAPAGRPRVLILLVGCWLCGGKRKKKKTEGQRTF